MSFIKITKNSLELLYFTVGTFSFTPEVLILRKYYKIKYGDI